MPKMDEIKKVLVIGSGPIVIGQAAEFDYAGTQACRSLKEEGMNVVPVRLAFLDLFTVSIPRFGISIQELGVIDALAEDRKSVV